MDLKPASLVTGHKELRHSVWLCRSCGIYVDNRLNTCQAEGLSADSDRHARVTRLRVLVEPIIQKSVATRGGSYESAYARACAWLCSAVEIPLGGLSSIPDSKLDKAIETVELWNSKKTSS